MTLNHPVRGVLLDMGWTVFRPVYSQWFIVEELVSHVNPDKIAALPRDRVEASVREAMGYLDENHLLFTLEEEYECFRMFYRIMARHFPELKIDEYVDKIAYDKVYNVKNYRLFPDARLTLTALKEWYRLGIISDTWPSIENILEDGGIAHLFDTRTYSCHLGVSKPHPRLFEHALSAMGIPACETVFVDDYEKNLDGAAQFGIQTVLICSRPDSKESERHINIKSLKELAEIL